MTTFIDGPAKGQTLQLRRAPIFLRVVWDGSKWDALDQLDDKMLAHEKGYAYQLSERPGAMHINYGGKRRNESGFYPMSKYKLCPRQPLQSIMRVNTTWVDYLNSLPEGEIPSFK